MRLCASEDLIAGARAPMGVGVYHSLHYRGM